MDPFRVKLTRVFLECTQGAVSMKKAVPYTTSKPPRPSNGPCRPRNCHEIATSHSISWKLSFVAHTGRAITWRCDRGLNDETYTDDTYLALSIDLDRYQLFRAKTVIHLVTEPARQKKKVQKSPYSKKDIYQTKLTHILPGISLLWGYGTCMERWRNFAPPKLARTTCNYRVNIAFQLFMHWHALHTMSCVIIIFFCMIHSDSNHKVLYREYS